MAQWFASTDNLSSDPSAAVRQKERGLSELLRHLQRQYDTSFLYETVVDQTILGTVTNADDGQPLPGVNVLAKNTTQGTITDIEGSYTLSVPDDTEVLVFSLVGYASQEVAINGQTTIDLAMSADVTELGEVVVTALGIEKDSKTLGYATTTVDSEELTVNRTPNVMNALQGRIAGVNISNLGTGPGGTSKIRIRGQLSISGQNNPLIVINGVPIDNTNFGTNPGGNDPNSLGPDGSQTSAGFTSDGGDGLSSINPDDIESMTVLKGATAAALYGSRAKDGVVMITTKKGGGTEGIGVTYNLNYTNEQPLDFTDYQYQYGQGENGVRPTTPNPTSGQWSFGKRFQPGMTQILFDGVEVPYEPVRDRIDKFFRNGQNVTNTISLSGGNERGGFHLSLANLSSEGVVPNNTFTRRTINLGVQYDLSEKLSVNGSINYSNENNENPPNVAQQDNTIPVALYNLANSMPLDVLDANKYDEDGNEAVYSRFRNRTNPYFTLQNGRLKNPIYSLQERGVNSLYGQLELSYRDFLFLNGTLRNDWFSTLSPDNRNILYPSVSLSYVLSESLGNTPAWLSFAKIRAAYAEVGSDTDVPPYSDVLFYEIRPNLFPDEDGTPLPLGRVDGNTVPNPDLRPMRAAEAEVGLNIGLFNDRISLDVAAYQKNTTDQIVQAQVSDASGYENTFINSGESRSRGVEMLLNVNPVNTRTSPGMSHLMRLTTSPKC